MTCTPVARVVGSYALNFHDIAGRFSLYRWRSSPGNFTWQLWRRKRIAPRVTEIRGYKYLSYPCVIPKAPKCFLTSSSLGVVTDLVSAVVRLLYLINPATA